MLSRFRCSSLRSYQLAFPWPRKLSAIPSPVTPTTASAYESMFKVLMWPILRLICIVDIASMKNRLICQSPGTLFTIMIVRGLSDESLFLNALLTRYHAGKLAVSLVSSFSTLSTRFSLSLWREELLLENAEHECNQSQLDESHIELQASRVLYRCSWSP